jgi:cytochrome c oxidase subunit 3
VTSQTLAIEPALFKSHAGIATSWEKLPGNIAVWILIYAELTEFALFFIVFLVVRAHNQEIFLEGPSQLNTMSGMINTLVLITSSFFMAQAIAAIKAGQKAACLTWLWLTLTAGAAYCGVKLWEYDVYREAGLSSRTNPFFTLYYYLTFNHLLHVLVGMCTIFWVTLRTHLACYDADDHEGLESAASYWHMIDLAWIIIFPLLYVLR